jgi:hypothetical protein
MGKVLDVKGTAPSHIDILIYSRKGQCYFAPLPLLTEKNISSIFSNKTAPTLNIQRIGAVLIYLFNFDISQAWPQWLPLRS